MERQRASRGRTRSEVSRQAVLAAAIQIIGIDGYAALSIERIARESGVGKQTVYRWWPTKADVVMEALLHKVEVHIPIPDTGALESDLRQFLTTSLQLGRMPQVAELLRALAAEAQLNPAFAERFRATFVDHRRAALTTILTRDDGRRPAPVRTSTLVDVVFGVIWYRLLILPTEFDDDLVTELITLLTQAGAR